MHADCATTLVASSDPVETSTDDVELNVMLAGAMAVGLTLPVEIALGEVNVTLEALRAPFTVIVPVGVERSIEAASVLLALMIRFA